MPDDLLEIDDLDDDTEGEVDDSAVVDTSFLAEPDAPADPAAVKPVEVRLDSSGIGKTIADALSGAPPAQTAPFRSLAQEFISSQPKPDAPKATREQIASRNATIQAALMDTTG